MENMYQKVKNEGVKYDVILVSDALMPRMIKQNLIQELNKDNMKKTIYNNIIILENDDYALVMPKYSPDGFINYYN